MPLTVVSLHLRARLVVIWGMKELTFATNNAHKIAEIRRQLGASYTFHSLEDIGCTEKIPETSGTIEGNARQKARHVYDNHGRNCFSEDTGLEVMALSGAPGVDTAHYAGPARDATANYVKLLSALGARRDREALFRTIICLNEDGRESVFEGICRGRIATAPMGRDGFGYDPVFIPEEGDGRTFAQMTADEKIRYSHRARAIAKLQAYLTSSSSSAESFSS